MANALGIDLTNKTVIFKAGTFREEYKRLEGMPFKVFDGIGNGRDPDSIGTGLYGVFANGMQDKVSGLAVEAVVEDDPTLNRIAELLSEAGKEAHTALEDKMQNGGVSVGSIDQLERTLFVRKLKAEGIINEENVFVKGPCAPDAPTPKVIFTKKRRAKAKA